MLCHHAAEPHLLSYEMSYFSNSSNRLLALSSARVFLERKYQLQKSTSGQASSASAAAQLSLHLGSMVGRCRHTASPAEERLLGGPTAILAFPPTQAPTEFWAPVTPQKPLCYKSRHLSYCDSSNGSGTGGRAALIWVYQTELPEVRALSSAFTSRLSFKQKFRSLKS